VGVCNTVVMDHSHVFWYSGAFIRSGCTSSYTTQQ